MKNQIKNYCLLTFGNATSKLGTKIFKVAMVWWIVNEMESLRLFGMISAAIILPQIIMNTFNGVIVDRFNRKYLLILSDLISGICCIAMAFIAYSDRFNLVLVTLIFIIMGMCEAFFNPTIRSILPDVIERENIKKCNFITTCVMELVRILGPILGGYLIGRPYIGVAGAFLLNGLSYFISAGSEGLIKYDAQHSKKKNRPPFLEDLIMGYKYLLSHSWLVKILISSSIINFFLASFNIIMPLYLKVIVDNSEMLYAKVLSAEAIGAIAASIIGVLLIKLKMKMPSLSLSILLTGISLFVFQFMKSSVTMLLMVVSFSFFLTSFNIQFVSAVQMKTDEHMLGRVFSFTTMVALCTMPVSNLIFGLVGEYILNYVYFISGLFIALASLLIPKSETQSS